MTPSTEAVKAAMEKAGYHASVSAVMAILQAAYDVDFEALRAENAKIQAALQARGGQVLERNALILDIYNACDHYLRSGKNIEVEQ